jgi:hypothetical protein
MPYCEFWLEMREEDNAFRVMLLLFQGDDPPDQYTLAEYQMQIPGRTLYVSRWFPDVHAAEADMNATARYCSGQGLKIMVFREIRKPCPPAQASGTEKPSRSKKRRERGH